jgi:uncharacterized protein
MERGQRALVTGASSGIGAAYATVLAARGCDLVLVARRGDRLAAQGDDLARRHGVDVEILAADLAEPQARGAVEVRLAADDIGLLVNNAGLGDMAPFAGQDRAAHARMVAVNVTAPMLLAHAALTPMLARGRGVLVNVASGFAMDFVAGAAVYAATKAAILQWSLVLAEELAGTGVQVQALVPGLTRTGLGGADAALFERFPPDMVMEPETLVRASLAGLALGETVCVPALDDPAAFAAAHDAWRGIGRGVSRREAAARYAMEDQQGRQAE